MQTVHEAPVGPPPAVAVLDADGTHIATNGSSDADDPFALQAEDWHVFEASVQGDAGSWLVVYVPLPAPSPSERWRFDIHVRAQDPAGGFVALLTTDVETVTGGGGDDPRTMLPRPRAFVSETGSVEWERAASVSTSIGGEGRGVIGYLYAATATAAWSANVSIARGDGSEPATTVFARSGTGTTVVRELEARDDSLGQGLDVTYRLEAAIPAPGWSHFHVQGPAEGPARWDWVINFPEGSARDSLLSSVHAPPALELRRDVGALDGVNGTFDATFRMVGVGAAPTMVFIHAPGVGPWMPDGFAQYGIL